MENLLVVFEGTENICIKFGNAHRSNLDYIPTEDESEAEEVENESESVLASKF